MLNYPTKQTREGETRCESKTTILMDEQGGKVCEGRNKWKVKAWLYKVRLWIYFELYVFFYTFLYLYADSTVLDANLHRGHGGYYLPISSSLYAMIKISPTWYPSKMDGSMKRVHLNILRESTDKDGVKDK